MKFPNSILSYHMLARKLQVTAIAIAIAALFFFALKAHAHVDLIHPGIEHAYPELMDLFHPKSEQDCLDTLNDCDRASRDRQNQDDDKFGGNHNHDD